MARLTWVLAVAGLTTSRSAISPLLSPCPHRAPPLPAPVGTAHRVAPSRGSGRRLSRARRSADRVRLGESSAPPCAKRVDRRTTQPARLSLSNRPYAPARGRRRRARLLGGGQQAARPPPNFGHDSARDLEVVASRQPLIDQHDVGADPTSNRDRILAVVASRPP